VGDRRFLVGGFAVIEHVLELSDLVNDPDSVPPADRELVGAVLESLDGVDECVRDQLDAVAVRGAPGLTATVRALLAPHHRNPANGYCMACPEEVQPVWPCPAWKAAHRWLIELDPITGNRHEDEWYLVPPS